MEFTSNHSFYPTIPQSPQEAQEANSRAISQEDRILDWMQIVNIRGLIPYTAWDLKEVEYFKEWEIVSIRRALHNLEKQGKISRIGFVKGPKGVRVGSYKVNNGLLF